VVASSRRFVEVVHNFRNIEKAIRAPPYDALNVRAIQLFVPAIRNEIQKL
jgi:hypothetical protein